jgi:hypothetical protein
VRRLTETLNLFITAVRGAERCNAKCETVHALPMFQDCGDATRCFDMRSLKPFDVAKNRFILASCLRTGSEHMQGSTERRSGAMERREQRQPGARQPESQGRVGSEQSKGGTTEQRSVTNLSSEQRTRLHQVIATGNIHRADNVNFSLAVGTVVPQTVRVYDAPETIVEILPQCRGFKYIVVQSELIIVDPNSLEIVAILPV